VLISIGTSSWQVSVRSISPSYDSGIQWIQVGRKWKYIDRGYLTSKWTSEITIAAIGETVGIIRSNINQAKENGTEINIFPASYEQVFGPEINYFSSINCVVIDSDAIFETGNLNEKNMVEWTFSIMATSSLFEKYLNFTGYFQNLKIQSVSRLDNPGSSFFDAESFGGMIGFGFKAPTAEVTYEGDLDDVAAGIAYLQTMRSATMTVSADIVWLFEQGSFTEGVKIISIEYDGSVDKAGKLWRFTVLYALDYE